MRNILFLLLCLCFTNAQASVPVQVFVLHSYSQEYPWTKGQHQGFVESLNSDLSRRYAVNTEYLDTKRTSYTPAYAELMAQYVQDKYKDYHPAAIYVTDDNALLFALSHLTKVFPNVPVFFSGVNDYGIKSKLDPSHTTGIFEKKEIVPNLQLMKRIDPAVREIIVVGDASETYLAIASEIKQEMTHYPEIHASYISASHIENLISLLRERKERFMFLTTVGAVKDREGRTLSIAETIGAILNAGRFEVFSMEDAYLYPGVLGGYVTSSQSQGQSASRLLQRYLDGVPVSALAPIENSPNEYILNETELAKAGFSLPKNLEGEVTLIEPIPSYYETHRPIILGLLFGLAGLFMVTLLISLFLVIRNNRQIALSSRHISEVKEGLVRAQSIAKMGSWRWDIRSGSLSWSDEIFKIFGLLPQAFGATYEAFMERVHSEDRQMVQSAVNAAINEMQTYDIKHRIVLPNGSVRFVQEQGEVQFDDKGAPLTMVGTVQDITERKKIEDNLRIAARAFESHESQMVTDANGVIQRVNKAFTENTGYTTEDAVGQTPRILQSGRHPPEFFRAMWETICSTGSWQGEIWDKRKNGEINPKWLTISAVKDDNGVVTHYVGSHLDITERKAAEKEIQLLAFYDPLTRLPNRRLLMERLKQALASSERIKRMGALLFIDLDNFKTLNDTLGHDIGDLLLQQVAQRLESCLRKVDTVARMGSDDFVARLGGDEFVVVLENLSEQALEAAALTEAIGEKILAVLIQPYQLDSNVYHGTASIGATLFDSTHQAMDELMKQADIAMYQAKKAGRNTLRFFDPKMQASISARVSLEEELRNALEKQQFQLYYQIQVDNSLHPLGAEALIRWNHPERGFVSPMQFIPLAEETGLILPIGQWVLDTACAQVKAWQQDARTRNLTLAVNVSAKQFHQADFVLLVKAVVQLHGINPMLLKLELTEGLMLENIEDTIATMNALNEVGVQLSLDDFGTGYSSLQYLKKLPLDQLKIDQSFVRDIASDESDKAIVRTIVAMAHSLNLNVIAEGVETEEQRQFLLDNGCTHYQGYLFSKPLPIEQFEALVKKS